MLDHSDHAPRADAPRPCATLDDVHRSVGHVKAIGVAVAVLLCFVLLRDADAPMTATAHAQSRGAQPAMANPADQRNEMVAQLERINSQLDAIRRQLDGGRPIKVEVVSMPREDRAESR